MLTRYRRLELESNLHEVGHRSGLRPTRTCGLEAKLRDHFERRGCEQCVGRPHDRNGRGHWSAKRVELKTNPDLAFHIVQLCRIARRGQSADQPSSLRSASHIFARERQRLSATRDWQWSGTGFGNRARKPVRALTTESKLPPASRRSSERDRRTFTRFALSWFLRCGARFRTVPRDGCRSSRGDRRRALCILCHGQQLRSYQGVESPRWLRGPAASRNAADFAHARGRSPALRASRYPRFQRRSLSDAPYRGESRTR